MTSHDISGKGETSSNLSREHYDMVSRGIMDDNLMTMSDKSTLHLKMILQVLLDIREKLFNPDMKK